MMIKTVENVAATTLNPSIVKSRKTISPSTMPADIKVACANPELRALETTAKVPGPGVAIKIKIAPRKVKVVRRSMLYFLVWLVSNGGPILNLTVIFEAFTGSIFAMIFEIFLAGSVKSMAEASSVERSSNTAAAAESFIFV